jgi:hypothetical protein
LVGQQSLKLSDARSNRAPETMETEYDYAPMFIARLRQLADCLENGTYSITDWAIENDYESKTSFTSISTKEITKTDS